MPKKGSLNDSSDAKNGSKLRTMFRLKEAKKYLKKFKISIQDLIANLEK